MVDAAKLVSATSAVALLLQSRSLFAIVKPTNRRWLFLQFRLAVLLFCARRAYELLERRWSSTPSSVSIARERNSLRELANRIMGFFSEPLGSVALAAVVPVGLGAAGLSVALAKPHQQVQRGRWWKRMLAYGSVPMFVKAVEEGWQGEEVDVIAVLAFELGLLMGERIGSTFILLMLTGGEALEQYAFTRARKGREHVLDENAPIAHRLVARSKERSQNGLEAGLLQMGGQGSKSETEDGRDLKQTASLGELKRAESVALEDVDVESVIKDDVIAVRCGEAIPVDGFVCTPMGHIFTDTPISSKTPCSSPLKSIAEQTYRVEEGLLTGENSPRTIQKNDPVYSGSVARDALWIRVTAPYKGSTLELMRKSLQDALDRKSQLQESSARAASLLQPITLAAAVLSIAFRRKAPPSTRWNAALSVLMAATPCPATIGVPVALLSSMRIAAHNSVLIKSAAAIESICHATNVVLDKTGTLTKGEPTVLSFVVCEDSTKSSLSARPVMQEPWVEIQYSNRYGEEVRNYLGRSLQDDDLVKTEIDGEILFCVLKNYDTDEFQRRFPIHIKVKDSTKSSLSVSSLQALQYVNSVESLCSHPLAAALRQYAAKEGAGNILKADKMDNTAGHGIVGTVAGKRVVVGIQSFVEKCGWEVQRFDLDGRLGHSQVAYFAIEGFCQGYITFEDELRPGTAASVRRLKDLGLEICILSGDRSAHVKHVATQVDVADVHSGFLPHEKAEKVKALVDARAEKESVIMIGDGCNDAPALAEAHVGIAVGTQSGLAEESADVVINSANPLAKVVQLVLLCRATMKTARRGVKGGLGLSALQVCAAAAGLLNPSQTAILQEIVDAGALANAVSVLRYRWN